MEYTIEGLCKAYNAGEKIKYIFFWKHTTAKDGSINETCFSQWWMSSFVENDVAYCCAEQYMMAEKARLFQDKVILQEIMTTKHPKQMKALGRKVKNFDAEVWDQKCYEIVKKGNKAKFLQNQDLWDFLKSTKKRVLVEASPLDRIWGIGMGKENPDIENPTKWKGKNLLGFALSEVRDELLKEEEENNE